MQADREAVVSLLELNIPEFFHPSEKVDFDDYLEKELEDYFVIEDAGTIIGAGGLNFLPDTKEARISWDFLHPDHTGKGLGSQLVKHRIDHVKRKYPHLDKISVRTSQLAHGFYARMGFELIHSEKDFWAPGFDLYHMVLVV